MSEKRRGLGRGLGALIPTAPAGGDTRPTDVFFRDEREKPSEGSATPDGGGGGGADEADDAAERFTGNQAPGDGDETMDGFTGNRAPEVAVEPHVASGPVDRFTGNGVTSAPEPGGHTLRDIDPDRGGSVGHVGHVGGVSGVDAGGADGGHHSGVGEGGVDGFGSGERGEGGGVEGAEPGPEPRLAPVPGAEFAEIPVELIRPNSRQPRQVFDEDQMAELVHSVREIGVLQPVVVRRLADGEAEPTRPAGTEGAEGVLTQVAQYELVMGERRWRAVMEAGQQRIPAIIKETRDDDLLRDALLENLHRTELNPLEEAAAYQQLLDDFGCTHEELAGRIGRSRPQISNTLRLLKLPPLVQRRVAAGVLSAGHARALLGLADGAGMERLAQRIVAEGLSVRNVEEIVTVGEDSGSQARRSPRAGARHPHLDDLAARLSDRFDTRVNIALGKRKGRLTVEFASVDDLNRIVDLLSPGEQAGEDRPHHGSAS